MKILTTNQTAYIASIMYGMNAFTYIAVFYVLVNGASGGGLAQSVAYTWSHPEGKETIEFILWVITVNSVMCILAFLSKKWVGLKLFTFIAIAWLLTIVVGYGAVDILLIVTYLIAAACLSARLFNKESGENYA